MNLMKLSVVLSKMGENKKHSLIKINANDSLEIMVKKVCKALEKSFDLNDFLGRDLENECILIDNKDGIEFYFENDTDNITLLNSVFNKNKKFVPFYYEGELGEITTYSKLENCKWHLKNNHNIKLENKCINDFIRNDLLKELEIDNYGIKKLYDLEKIKNEIKNPMNWFDGNFKYSYYYGYNKEIHKNFDSEEILLIVNKHFNTSCNVNLAMLKEIKQKILLYISKINGVIYQVNEQNRLNKEFSRATIIDRKKHDDVGNDNIIKSISIFKNTKIEIDKDNDKNKIIEFKNYFNEFLQNLSVNINLNHFKIRYLGNYKAIGLYVNALKLIAIDLRDTTAIVHELGHYIDYNYSDMQLSLKNEFDNILNLYINDLKKVASLAKKFDYYSQPTEIFARCFDYYCQICGTVPFKIIHKKTDDYKIIFDNIEMQALIIKYFDNLELINKPNENKLMA